MRRPPGAARSGRSWSICSVHIRPASTNSSRISWASSVGPGAPHPLVAQVGLAAAGRTSRGRGHRPSRSAFGKPKPIAVSSLGESDEHDLLRVELRSTQHLDLVGPGQRRPTRRTASESVTSVEVCGRLCEPAGGGESICELCRRGVTRAPKSSRTRSRVAASTSWPRGVISASTATVLGCDAADEAGRLQPSHDRGHRRRMHLEPLAHLPQRQRAAGGRTRAAPAPRSARRSAVRLEGARRVDRSPAVEPHQRRDGVRRGHALRRWPTGGRPRRSGRRAEAGTRA